MENLAFIHHAVAYEDPSPEPKLRSLKDLGITIPSSAWLTATSFIALLCVISPSLVAQALVNRVMVSTNGRTLYGRTGPGTRYSWVDYYRNGTILDTTGETRDGWYKLTDGLWVSGTWVTPVSDNALAVSTTTSSGTVTVKTNGGRLHGRKGAGTQYPWVAHYPNGTVLTITGETKGGWYKLTNGLWVSGKWVSDKRLLSIAQSEPVSIPESASEDNRSESSASANTNGSETVNNPNTSGDESQLTSETQLETVSIPDFDPKKDGFQFNNTMLTDEITKNNPDFQGVSTDNVSADQDTKNSRQATVGFGSEALATSVKTQLFSNFDKSYWKKSALWLFGNNICINPEAVVNQESLDIEKAKDCILSGHARNWLTLQSNLLRNGVCEGMAIASLYLWHYKKYHEQETPTSYEPVTHLTTTIENILDDKHPTANQLEKTNSFLQRYVAELSILQRIEKVNQLTQDTRNYPPSEILNLIKESIRKVQNDPLTNVTELYTIGIYNVQGYGLTDGHTLTPYKVVDVSNNESKVYVYDSNLSGKDHESNFPNQELDSPHILFKKNENTWSYEFPKGERYSGDRKTKNLELTKIKWLELGPQGYFDCLLCKPGKDQSINIFVEGSQQLEIQDYTSPEDVAQFFINGGLNTDAPPIYNLSSGNHTIQAIQSSSTSDSNQTSSLYIFGDDFITGLQNIASNSLNSFKINIASTDNGLTLVLETNEGGEITIPNLFVSVVSLKEGHNYNFIFEIKDINITKGTDIFLIINNRDGYFSIGDNSDQRNSYKVEVTLAGDTKSKVPFTTDVQSDIVPRFSYGEWTKEIEQDSLNNATLGFSLWNRKDIIREQESSLPEGLSLLDSLTKNQNIDNKPPQKGGKFGKGDDQTE